MKNLSDGNGRTKDVLNHVLIFEVVTKFVTELLIPILHK